MPSWNWAIASSGRPDWAGARPRLQCAHGRLGSSVTLRPRCSSASLNLPVRASAMPRLSWAPAFPGSRRRLGILRHGFVRHRTKTDRGRAEVK